VTTTTPFQEGSWADVIEVEVAVQIWSATRRDGRCDPVRRSSGWEATVTSSFTIDDFRAGAIVIPIPLESTTGGTGFDDALAVVIQGDVRG
jgi:hypothetical protein